MTNPLSQSGRSGQGLPTPPSGWPIGSYPTYAEAQKAVDYIMAHTAQADRMAAE